MIKRLCLLLLCFISIFSTFDSGASAKSVPPPLEDVFSDIGYKPIEDALTDCESYFKKEIKIPYKVPPISFTHQMGRCSEKIDEFELKFINEDVPKNHYKLNIRPSDQGISFEKELVSQKYELDSGMEALFYTKALDGFNLLIFEKDGWQYMLSIDKRVADTVSPKVMVEIANAF